MKDFIELGFDPEQCRRELDEFRALLDNSQELGERDDILPFFGQRPHLSAFIGSYYPYMSTFDRLAPEYPLFGDFVCDLVIGDSKNARYCFVEFEDAKPTSIFRQSGSRSSPEWSPRFEHGFSQIVDWFWKLDDMRATADFETRFLSSAINYLGILIIGRSSYLDVPLENRLQWRLDRVVVDSKNIVCITFDKLFVDLDARLTTYGLESSRKPEVGQVSLSRDTR